MRLSAVSSAAPRDSTADESRARFTSECASRNFAATHEHPVLEIRDSRSRLSIRNSRHRLEEGALRDQRHNGDVGLVAGMDEREEGHF
jgi:hypothetical protein